MTERKNVTSAEMQKTPKAQKKGKCSGVYFTRLVLGVIIITLVIVFTQVQAEGWQNIFEALFGVITVQDVVRYVVIVVLSMITGYWMKKPKKVYVHDKNKNSEVQKTEE